MNDKERLGRQLHQIALLHTALRHAEAALPANASDELRAEIVTALSASESTAPDIVAALLGN